MVKKIR